MGGSVEKPSLWEIHKAIAGYYHVAWTAKQFEHLAG